MIYDMLHTTSSDRKLLQSGGEINLFATMKMQIVYPNKFGLGFIQSKSST